MAEFINVARPLQNLGTGDPRAITQTLIDATVSEAFEKTAVMMTGGWVGRTDLGSGEASRDFVIEGNTPEDGEFYVTGQATDGGTMINTKVNVTLDDIWYKQLNLPKIDLILANWDVISPKLRECVRIVTERQENLAHRLWVAAARGAAVSNVHAGGNVVTVVDADGAYGATGAFPVSNAGADAFELALSNLAKQMDDDDIPRGTGVRELLITPSIAQVLTFSNRLTNREVIGANVDISNRSFGTLHGFNIVGISRFFPTTNITNDLSKYNINCAYTGTGEPVALARVNAGAGNAVEYVTQGGIETKMWIDEETMDTRKTRASFLGGFGTRNVWQAGMIQVKSS